MSSAARDGKDEPDRLRCGEEVVAAIALVRRIPVTTYLRRLDVLGVVSHRAARTTTRHRPEGSHRSVRIPPLGSRTPGIEIVVCGLALDYADPEHPLGDLATPREPVARFAAFHGEFAAPLDVPAPEP